MTEGQTWRCEGCGGRYYVGHRCVTCEARRSLSRQTRFSEEFEFCWICHNGERWEGTTRDLRIYSVDPQPFAERECLLRLCNMCIGMVIGSPRVWSLPRLMALKQLKDPKYFDLDHVNSRLALEKRGPVTRADVIRWRARDGRRLGRPLGS